MKRRMFAAVLAAAMIVSLSACGGGTGGGSSASNPDGSASSSSGAASSQPDASQPAVSMPDVSTPGLSQPDASIPDGSQPDASNPSGSTSAGDSAKPGKVNLTLNKTSVKLTKAGATFNLRYTLEPESDAKVKFISSDEKIATVNSKGVITAVAPGKAGITVQCDGADYVIVSVECDWKEDSSSSSSTGSAAAKVTLNSSSITLSAAGETYQLTATVEPKSSQKLEFYSSNPKVATVSAGGLITAVAPGKVTVTVACGGASTIASVNCSWTEAAPPEPSKTVDLSSFYSTITGKYQFSFMMEADDTMLSTYFAGLSGLSLSQQIVNLCGMSPAPNGDFVLIQVSNSKDVSTVKNILQARIDYMVGDGNGPGGAWYPMEQTTWEEYSRIAVNGDYVMLIAHENCDDIVKEFNALF